MIELVEETARAKSIVLEPPRWEGQRAGQHVDVRLTGKDGYQTERSYSIASAPEDDRLVLTVERLEQGEVSRYLVDELRTGDQLELRGPVGGWFVWDGELGGPLLLIAGGSGIAPMRAIVRHHTASNSDVSLRLLYSARALDEVIYRDELTHFSHSSELDVRFTLTRRWPEQWGGYRRRVDHAMLEDVAWPAAERPLTYICGSNGFVEAAASSLVDLGHDPHRIRTERFGPTGG